MGRIAAVSETATRFFAWWVLIAAIAAILSPQLFLPVLPAVKWLLGLIMFGMGMTLRFGDFARVLRQPKAVIAGVALQYLIMPIAGVAVAYALRLPPELAAGIVLLGSCPGGTASNVIVYLSRGDVALSVSLTAISTMLAPILTPVLTYLLAGRWMEVSASALFTDIVQIVLLPLSLGLLLHRFAGEAMNRVKPVLPLVSVVSIITIIAAVVAANAGRLVESGIPAAAAVILHNCLGLLGGWVAAKALGLEEGQRRALAVEVGMQNSGLAAALATAHLSPLAALPGALFSVWHNLSGAILVSFWRRRTN